MGATALLSVALAACVIVSDDDSGPVLGIELFWDEVTAGDTFLGGTCYSADVEEMSWALSAEDGFVVADRELQACRDRIEVSEIEPGEYTLDITGFDGDGEPRWRTHCTGLVIVRFNELYGCDIHSVDPDGSDEPTEPDGGTPDGG